MTQGSTAGGAGSNRLNVELGERLATDVETLRRVIQDSLEYRHRVSLAEVVRLALDHLHLAYLEDRSKRSLLTKAEAKTYADLCVLLENTKACPRWLLDLYTVGGFPSVSEVNANAAPGKKTRAAKPKE